MRFALLVLLCAFASGCVSSEAVIQKRATGYSRKTLFDCADIDASNGIDRTEAAAIAEWRIFGSVDMHKISVTSYSVPFDEGLTWRIEVVIRSPYGHKPVRRPLHVSKLSGMDYGDGWTLVGPVAVDIGDAEYRIQEFKDGARIEVALKGFFGPGDEEAKARCITAARRACEMISEKLAAWVEPVDPDDMNVREVQWYDVSPNRSWEAQIPITIKQPSK